MAENTPIRDSREMLQVQGIGGYLAVGVIDNARQGNLTGDVESFGLYLSDKLDVRRWQLWHRYHNVQIPMSGGGGAITRRRVADDFDFIAEWMLDAKYILPTEPLPSNQIVASSAGPATQPFIENRFQGIAPAQFQVQVKFQLGDPTFYTQPELQSIARTFGTVQTGAYYFCDSVQVDEIYVVDTSDQEPGDVIRGIVKGSGSAPLRRYLDPGGWMGTGAWGSGNQNGAL